MDALGVDRPRALVLGPSSLLGVACVLELLHRGYEVHLPGSLLPPPDCWPDQAHRLHASAADGETTAGAREILAEVTAAGHQVSATILTAVPVDHRLVASALAGLERRSGGRLLVREPPRVTPAHSCSVTVLSPSAWPTWLPLGPRRLRRPDDDLADADAVARRAVSALLARQSFVSFGYQPWLPPRVPARAA